MNILKRPKQVGMNGLENVLQGAVPLLLFQDLLTFFHLLLFDVIFCEGPAKAVDKIEKY